MDSDSIAWTWYKRASRFYLTWWGFKIDRYVTGMFLLTLKGLGTFHWPVGFRKWTGWSIKNKFWWYFAALFCIFRKEFTVVVYLYKIFSLLASLLHEPQKRDILFIPFCLYRPFILVWLCEPLHQFDQYGYCYIVYFSRFTLIKRMITYTCHCLWKYCIPQLSYVHGPRMVFNPFKAF